MKRQNGDLAVCGISFATCG